MPSRNSTTTLTQTANAYGVLGCGYSAGMRPRSLTDEYKLAHNNEAETLMKYVLYQDGCSVFFLLFFDQGLPQCTC